MHLAAGLLLIAAIFYVSLLACSLPGHSRARLSEKLPLDGRDKWLDWLDRHEWELRALLGVLRAALSLGLLAGVWAWHCGASRTPVELGSLVYAGAVSLVLLAAFGVAVPHSLALHAGETVLARNLHLLRLMRWGLWPVGQVFRAIEFIVRRLLGKPEAGEEVQTQRVEREILEAVSEGEATGVVDEDQKEMIESVFELDETPVSAIMTPRTDIDAVPVDASYEQVRQTILRSGHSRIPVYEGSVDHVVGVLYAKDLLRLNPNEPFDPRTIMRTVPYVPEGKTLDELLAEFRATKVHIAIVLDEYGGTAGLATIEDILEELVGEIDDEYDQQPPPAINRIDASTLEVDARVHVSEINAELGTELPQEDDYETIGGFVFATLGRIPTTGEQLQHGNLRLTVVDAEPRRIKRLRIQVQPDHTPGQ